jgi:hypothetical protein
MATVTTHAQEAVFEAAAREVVLELPPHVPVELSD